MIGDLLREVDRVQPRLLRMVVHGALLSARTPKQAFIAAFLQEGLRWWQHRAVYFDPEALAGFPTAAEVESVFCRHGRVRKFCEACGFTTAPSEGSGA